MPEFLLANPAGMTTVVFSEVDRDKYIMRGFSLVSEEETPPVLLTSNAAIKINVATPKELIDNLEITRAIAKQIIDNRPYNSIEELVIKNPTIPWVSYQLSFELV